MSADTGIPGVGPNFPFGFIDGVCTRYLPQYASIGLVGVAEIAGRLEDVIRLHTKLADGPKAGALADLAVLKAIAIRKNSLV